MNLDYRDAGPDDAASVAEVGRQTFIETFGHLYRPEDLAAFLEIHTEESWRGELADSDLKVLLVEQAGKPVAYAKVASQSLPYLPDREAMELRQFYVLKPWQGEGIAPRLMDWVLAQAKARGAGEICLSVWSENARAKRFYARYGFEYVGPYKFMVGEQADEDEIWRLKLEDSQ
ncbi:MAG: family N-acetyltransferase [Alphaproteobacteria bacterium]|nr:family N-acetyltransferase [Alphaproteobacteria bacterium]